jgi:hypothetical protein
MAKRSRDATSFDHVAALDLPIVKHRRGTLCFRIHRTSHAPLRFGTTADAGRFSAPAGQYRTCYFGLSIEAAFSETLLRNPTNRLLATTDLAARSISTGHLTRQVRLAQVHGAGLKRLGISTATVHGSYPACRQLALALWNHTLKIDGIEYRSRFDNDELCIALFDRASDAVVIDYTEGVMDDPHRLGELLDKYDVGLEPW